eukprot:UN08297
MRTPDYKPSPAPVVQLTLTPDQYKPTHIQYISGYQYIPINDVAATRTEMLQRLKKLRMFWVVFNIWEDGVNVQMCAHPSNTDAAIDV